MSNNKDGFNKEKFVGKVEGKLEDKYEILNEIGTGGFSRCYKVKNKTTGVSYACKELQKTKLSDYEGLMREVNLMIKLDHPNIIKLYEVYENEKYIYLIMELCTGGELFDRIVEKTDQGVQFSEEEAASLFKQMMSAINYCHKNGIVHRDLKPENLLFLTKDDKSPIKVIDFGMSKRFDSKNFMSEKVGTAYYISPEVLQGKYDEKCDIWSAGVILYIIICGYPCFNGEDDDEIFAAIRKGKIVFPSPEWDDVSNDVRELIKKIKDIFQSIDINNDGKLSLEEIKKAVGKADGLKAENVEEIFKSIDTDNSGNIEYTEFISASIEKNLYLNEEKLKDAFKLFDADNSGKISRAEIENVLKMDKNSKEIEAIMAKHDKNKDGEIDFQEFMDMMKEIS